MKILWVKAGGLVPPDIGGKIRSYCILKELAKTHAVTLFTFYAAHPGDMHSQLDTEFEKVVYLPMHVATNRGLGELTSFVSNVFSPWPHTVSKYCRPEVVASLRELLAEQSYDVIVCDFVVAAGAIPWEVECPKVVFTHNVEALIWRRHFEVSRNPVWRLVSWGEYKMTIVSTGVDTEYFRPDAGKELSCSLVFTGSMDWMPNEDGVLYFLRLILPLIRWEIPQVRFNIVGRQPSDKLRAAVASDPGVRVTGRVEDIRPYVHEGSVYVVPLRIGSGTRLKIFEAMAMGKAIVSTSLGAEGLPVNDGSDISIADSPEEFARKVVALLRDPEERSRLGLAARQLVEQRYSWSSVAAEFDAVLRRVARLSNGREMNLSVDEIATVRGVT